jgi:hypothetical protein
MELKDVVDKVSSYNIFNYLLPGFLFNAILCKTTHIMECKDLEMTLIVLMYFEGLIISRIGSMVIEELLLKYGLIKKINTDVLFTKFKNNSKLEVIFEAMNMYRSLASMTILLSLFTFYDITINRQYSCLGLVYTLLEFLLFVLFVFSFVKQRNKVLHCLE